MDLTFRKQIVFGFWVLIVGLFIARFVPLIPAVAMQYNMNVFDVKSMSESMALMQKLNLACICIGGGLTLLGGLITAVSWSRWFIASARPDNGTVN